MTIYDYIQDKYPDLRELLKEMRAIQADWSLLPKEYADINVRDIPCFIMTYNRPFDKQSTYKYMKDFSHVVFVCSTDDPYLEKFKEECQEEILVFDKADYLYSDEDNGDDFGLEYPFNQCGVFARRFIDDYSQTHKLERFIVADNDLKFWVKFCDRKTIKFEDNPQAVKFGIQLYFYLLEKYDFLHYVTAIHDGIEMMGKLFDYGFYYAPVSLNFHTYKNPCHWVSRMIDDWITPMKILEETGKLSLNLPIIKIGQTTACGDGDMSKAYKAVYEKFKDTPLMKDSKVKDNVRGVRTVQTIYNEKFFPGSTKRGVQQRSNLIKSIIEKRENG